MNLIKKLVVPVALLTLSNHVALARHETSTHAEVNNEDINNEPVQKKQRVVERGHKMRVDDATASELKVDHLANALKAAMPSSLYDLDKEITKNKATTVIDVEATERRIDTAAVTDEYKKRQRILQGKASGSSRSRSRNSRRSRRSSRRSRSRRSRRSNRRDDDDYYYDDYYYDDDRYYNGGGHGVTYWHMPSWNQWGSSSSSSNDAWGYRFEEWGSSSSSKDGWGEAHSINKPSPSPTTAKPTTAKPIGPTGVAGAEGAPTSAKSNKGSKGGNTVKVAKSSKGKTKKTQRPTSKSSKGKTGKIQPVTDDPILTQLTSHTDFSYVFIESIEHLQDKSMSMIT